MDRGGVAAAATVRETLVIEEWVAETENGQAILDAFTASYATHSEGD